MAFVLCTFSRTKCGSDVERVDGDGDGISELRSISAIDACFLAFLLACWLASCSMYPKRGAARAPSPQTCLPRSGV